MGSLCRWLGLVCLLLIGVGWGSLGMAASPTKIAPEALSPAVEVIPHTPQAVAQQRLEAIGEAMQTIRLCNRPNCRYRDISVEVRPILGTDTDPTLEYEGTINAIIDRPSGSLDKAHYRLQFRQGRWQLLGGEEVSDVSSFFFEGDTYEVFSTYSTRSRKEKLADARSSLRVGYRELYYRVFDQGQER
ncbi:hypothetical protein L1047_09810 [Synechococcus sp. Nb3U1]|nr:hypothetical protein [Synechococcus sp. Nb3U1]